MLCAQKFGDTYPLILTFSVYYIYFQFFFTFFCLSKIYTSKKQYLCSRKIKKAVAREHRTHTQSIFIYNLKTEHGTPQIVPQVMKTTNTNTTNNKKEFATYNERMQVNKSALVGNLSKLFKDVTKGAIIPADVVGVDKKDFAEFRAYMIERHKLGENESPARGWSVWYALQFCEKRIKAAAADENAPTHKKAVAYLRQTRAAMQEQANKLF